jgi:hypothetical protein
MTPHHPERRPSRDEPRRQQQVSALRDLDLAKPPGVAEAISWEDADGRCR